MSLLTRKLQKIFGSNAANSDVTVYGSPKTGTVQFSKDLDAIQSLPAWINGQRDALLDIGAPDMRDHNAIFYLLTSQIAYLFQKGIPEWIATEQYYANKSFCSYNGSVYVAIVDNINIPPTDMSTWKNIAVAAEYNGIIAIGGGSSGITLVNGAIEINMDYLFSPNVASNRKIAVGTIVMQYFPNISGIDKIIVSPNSSIDASGNPETWGSTIYRNYPNYNIGTQEISVTIPNLGTGSKFYIIGLDANFNKVNFTSQAGESRVTFSGTYI